jgi:hypothetical protein
MPPVSLGRGPRSPKPTPPVRTHRNSKLLLIASLGALNVAGCAGGAYTPGIQRTPIINDTLASSDSIRVVAGPEYDAGWLHRVFFGDHYRDLWATDISVERLDLSTVAGGLWPTEAGGGFQTKSLKFRSGDGRRFKFRSVNKDPTAILPFELKNTFAADLAQDHISTSHPAAAIVVDSLAAAVGVPHLQSRLVYLADDPRLGVFREQFGGLLGVFELYPDDGFQGCEKVQNTIKVFRQLDEDSRDRVNAAAYLRARFLDILVGDWDRHVKQWKWMCIREDGNKVWYPLPMDRDMAFARLDGFFTWIASMSVSQFSHFDREFGDVSKLTFSGQYLDRRLLVGLQWHTWDSIATAFISSLTDEVIDGAVRRLPPEYFARDGEQLSDYVDITLSNKREYVTVDRLPEGEVRVRAWRWDKEAGGPTGSPVFARTFQARETKEIRLYLMGKDDHVVVDGHVEESIPVRVIGGKGDDELVDSSDVRGALLGFLPFRTSRTMTYFYDDSGDNVITEGPGTCVDTSTFQRPSGGQHQY